MAAVVVDTDVLSFQFKRDTRADLYDAHLAHKILTVSFMTVAELDLWALLHRWGEARKKGMQELLRAYLIHPFDRELCLKWAEVTSSVRRKGHDIQVGDAWIAATALRHGIPLVTHNRRDFANVEGLTVISETEKP